MALLEETNSCAICERPVSGNVSGVPIYLCRTCYAQWEKEVLADSPWVRELVRLERVRRRRRNRLLAHGGLPVFVSAYDVALLGGE